MKLHRVAGALALPPVAACLDRRPSYFEAASRDSSLVGQRPVMLGCFGQDVAKWSDLAVPVCHPSLIPASVSQPRV